MILMAYVIVMGFTVPLGQGITKVSPEIATVGEKLTYHIQGYNTRFRNNTGIRVWLKHDNFLLESTAQDFKDEQSADVQFEFPRFVDTAKAYVDLSLIMDTPDGPVVLPSAVSLKNIADSSGKVKLTWSDQLTIHPHKESNFNYPFRNIFGETIRNTYFHVPLWFAMTFLFMFSVYYSIRYLNKNNPIDDDKVESLVRVGTLFGVLGTLTGSIWARYTWGSFWSFDVKQNMAAIALLIYGGYFLLRSSISDPDAKSRLGNIFNIFAFAMLIPLIFIIPRRFDSLHPGNGGNPALSTQDLDNSMRIVFYPAVIAYILIGFWMAELVYRYRLTYNKLNKIN